MTENKEKKPSLIEEALLEANEIQKVAENNAKEILVSQMKPEIDKIVKESIEEEESVDENKQVEESHDQHQVDEEESTKNNVKEDDDNDDDLGNLEIGDEESEISVDDGAGEIEHVDLTDSDDGEVVKVFKKMTNDDQIEITKDGDTIKLKDEDKEYLIQLSESKLNEEGICEDCPDTNYSTDMENNDEMIYEIELEEGDENTSEETVSETDDVTEETEKKVEETFNLTNTEGRNTTSQPDNFRGHTRPGDSRYKKLYQEAVQKNKQLVGKFKSLKSKAIKIVSESKDFGSKEVQYRSALTDMRKKLNEVALFNTNLAYVNRIMAEETTTKKEKFDMIKRFDKVKTIKESKQLYKTILSEVKKEPIKESVENKITKTSKSGTSKQINEQKVHFNDPQLESQIKRMKEIMNYDSKHGK